MPRLCHTRGANSENFQNSRGKVKFYLDIFPTKLSRGATPHPHPQHPFWASLCITILRALNI